jgi:hypothetical protein
MKVSSMLLTSIALVGLVSGCAGAGMRAGSFPRDQVPAEYVENQLAGTWRGSFSQLEASLYEDEGDCVVQIRPDGTFTATISRAKLGTNNLAKAEQFSGTVVSRGNRVTLVTAQGPRLTLVHRGDSLYTVAEDPAVEAPIAMSLRHERSQLSESGTPPVPPLQ